MKEGIYFVYNDVKSADMGLINCTIEGGMFEETFLPNREIKEVSVGGNKKNYFQSVIYSPLEFQLTFAFEDRYDERKIRDIAVWLNQDYYKPFYTTDNPDRIFYCMVKGDSTLTHNGLKQGYITLTMQCDSPYSYSPYINRDNVSFSNEQETILTFTEENYNALMGTQDNILINVGDMQINSASPVWDDYLGMTWEDIG